MSVELFIVEGKSAASSLRQALDKPSQNVLALQGKLINVTKAKPAKVFANQECLKIFQSLGCGVGKDCKPDQLNYSHVLILTDPDIDGAHARALMLTLFDQYLKPLIASGLVSVIVPPLFRISEAQTEQVHYAWNEQQRDQIIHKMDPANDPVITRFKGVAQFSPEECQQLLLQPQTRTQINLRPG